MLSVCLMYASRSSELDARRGNDSALIHVVMLTAKLSAVAHIVQGEVLLMNVSKDSVACDH